jgi:cytochrome P450
MRSPSLASSVRAEIATATASLSPPSLSTLYRLPPSELVAALPLCNAAFQESLRLYTESFSIRVVQEDMIIPAHLCAGGAVAETGFALKKGEQVICNTRPGAVDNGAWGRDATQWDAQAMLRDGKRGGMAPFGGGVSMCEGMSSLAMACYLPGSGPLHQAWAVEKESLL